MYIGSRVQSSWLHVKQTGIRFDNNKFLFMFTGMPGTAGRECNISSLSFDGCSSLCCGRGYYSEKRLAKRQCGCSFHWCCKVTCQYCEEEEIAYFCNQTWNMGTIFLHERLGSCQFLHETLLFGSGSEILERAIKNILRMPRQTNPFNLLPWNYSWKRHLQILWKRALSSSLLAKAGTFILFHQFQTRYA